MIETTCPGPIAGTQRPHTAPESPSAPDDPSLGELAQRLKAIALHQFEAKKDQAGERLRSLACTAAIAAIAAVTGIATLATGAVLAVSGLAMLLAQALPHPGLAPLIVGLAVIAMALSVAWFMIRRWRRRSDELLRAKYERLHQEQRRAFGADIHAMARERTP